MSYILLALGIIIVLNVLFEKRSTRKELNKEKAAMFCKLNKIKECRNWDPDKASRKFQGVLAHESRTSVVSRMTPCVSNEEIHRACHGEMQH